jgi:hypothetical protein
MNRDGSLTCWRSGVLPGWEGYPRFLYECGILSLKQEGGGLPKSGGNGGYPLPTSRSAGPLLPQGTEGEPPSSDGGPQETVRYAVKMRGDPPAFVERGGGGGHAILGGGTPHPDLFWEWSAHDPMFF